jgi:hypothetical protein
MKQLVLAITLGSIFLMYSNIGMCQQKNESKKQPFVHAEIWKDIDGKPINAHGAGVLFHNGTYYMFGEIKKGKTWLVPAQTWEDYRACRRRFLLFLQRSFEVEI